MERDIINLLIKISEHEQDNDAYIAGIILKNVKDLYHLKNKELATLCHVDSATITRFIQRLGFDTYSDFKHWGKEIFRSIDYGIVNELNDQSVIERDIHALLQTKQIIKHNVIQKLVNDLTNYDTVVLSGGRFSQLACQDLQMRLLSVGKYAKTFKDTKQQFEYIKQNPNGLLIQFSASYSHPYAALTEKVAKDNHYKIYLITREGNHIDTCDEIIHFPNNDKAFSVNSMEDRICMLSIVDVIFLNYLKKLQVMQFDG